MRRLARLALAATVTATASACVTEHVIKANAVPAQIASEAIEEELLLDVGVLLFDAGLTLPEGAEASTQDPYDTAIAAEDLSASEAAQRSLVGVRAAESMYLPFVLKNTLQDTGFWGAVRVIPSSEPSVDVRVYGKILQSDGEVLKVNVRVEDVTGHTWFDRDYSDMASKFAYMDEGPDEDPFQDVFNQIADDMLAAKRELSDDDIVRLRRISELKFAQSVSPDAFGPYMRETRDGYEILRLPAEDDPMVARVERIREREHMFIDALEQYYAAFQADAAEPYEYWRGSSYDETISLRELKKQARNRMLVGSSLMAVGVYQSRTARNLVDVYGASANMRAGINTLKSGIDKRSLAKIHAAALRELSESFSAEVRPMVVEVEGQTRTLTGSVEDQFAEWRQLLKEIYASETGVTSEGESGTLR